MSYPTSLNFDGKQILISPQHYYDLDHNNYTTEIPTCYYRNSSYRVFSRVNKTFFRFCAENNVNLSASPYATTDVEKIPLDELRCLAKFNLEGLFTKARIMRVIDALHLDVIFFVPFSFFLSYMVHTNSKKVTFTRKGIPFTEEGGLFLREECLLADIEIFPKDNQLRQQLALESLTALCNGIGNIIYLEFHDKGQSRYHSVTPYFDSSKEFVMIDELCQQLHPDEGHLFHRLN